MKHIYPLKVCPFCKQTPTIEMYLNQETWLPKVKCKNPHCEFQPSTKYIPIRKTQKQSYETCKFKIENVIYNWNMNCPMEAKEGIEIDYEQMIKYNGPTNLA
jgi:hypothetical protein